MSDASPPPDFAAEGLLDDVPEEPHRSARRRLLEHLHRDGVPLDELRAAVANERLALLPVERFLAGEGRYRREEIAERSGVPAEVLARQRRALGLPDPEDDDTPRYDDRDLQAARRLKDVLGAGIPPEDLEDLARVIGRATAQVADAARGIAGASVLRPGTTELELGLRWAQTAEFLTPLLAEQLEYALGLHLRELTRNDAVEASVLLSGRPLETRQVTVAFADLVGFTKLGESLPADELGGVATRLEELAGAVVATPVQLVKTIGDAAMLVAPEPGPLLDATFELLQAAEAEGPGFPQLRAGLAAGEAVKRRADWYGAPVNLASRLVALARPGSVLTTEAVRERVGDGARWSKAGFRRVKGVSEPVAVWRARPGGD